MKGGQRLGAGRPKDPDARRALLQVRLSDEEMALLKRTAKDLRMSVSDLVRRALGL